MKTNKMDHINNKKLVSVYEDDYIRERYEQATRWVVKLSNGETVYDDMYRYGESDNSWIRLGKYVRQEKLSI